MPVDPDKKNCTPTQKGSFRPVDLITLPTWAELPEHDRWSQYYVLALLVLRQFLGNDWLNRWVVNSKSKSDFFRKDWSTEVRRHQHLLRVFKLAEMLVNLENVEGFWQLVDQMKSSDPESRFAELETAALLRMSEIPFWFNEQTGVAGNDYDICAEINGLQVCCEVKCKMESTNPSSSTVVKSIKTAIQNNLPSEKPGIIFLKIPFEWFPNLWNGTPESNPLLLEILTESISYIETTGRIVALTMYISPEFLNSDRFFGGTLPITIVNRNSRFYGNWVENLYSMEKRTWISLRKIWEPFMPPSDE